MFHKIQIMSDRRLFGCSKCDKTYANVEGLKRHIKEKHENIRRGRCRCRICQKSFTTIGKLRDHLNVQHNDKGETINDQKYECNVCSKVFQWRNSIVGHLRYAHDMGSTRRVLFTCHFCKRNFNKKGNLEYHIQYSACSSNPNRDTRPRIVCHKCGVPVLENYIKCHLKFYCAGVPFEKKKKYKGINKRKEERTSEYFDIHIQNQEHTKDIKNTVTVRELKLKTKIEDFNINEQNREEELTTTKDYQEELSTSRRNLRKRERVDYRTLDDPYANSIKKLGGKSLKELTTTDYLAKPQRITETVTVTFSDPCNNVEGLTRDLKVEPAEESYNLVKEDTQLRFDVTYFGLNHGDEILQSIKQESTTDKDVYGDWCVPTQDDIVMKTDVEDHNLLEDTTSVDE